jgi:hypothetical protein
MGAGRSELWILDFEFWVGECCQRMPKQLLGSKLAVLVSIQNSALKIQNSLLELGIFGGGFDDGGEDFFDTGSFCQEVFGALGAEDA